MERIEELILTEIREYHRGRANAITYKALAERFGASERMVRKVVANLVLIYHQRICSNYDSRCGGYYWPETAEEIEKNYECLKNHGLNILRHAAAVKNAAPLELWGQWGLEL